jgi:hypothetical protein
MLLAGCFSHASPEVSLAGAQLAQSNDTARVVNITLDARNPGPDPIAIYDVRYAVTVDGHEVFEGVRAGEAVLGRYATRSIVLPVAIPASVLGAGSTPAEVSATVTYVPPGAFREVLFDAGWKPTVSVRGPATLEVPQAR